jgi:hypothetical protein
LTCWLGRWLLEAPAAAGALAAGLLQALSLAAAPLSGLCRLLLLQQTTLEVRWRAAVWQQPWLARQQPLPLPTPAAALLLPPQWAAGPLRLAWLP